MRTTVAMHIEGGAEQTQGFVVDRVVVALTRQDVEHLLKHGEFIELREKVTTVLRIELEPNRYDFQRGDPGDETQHV